ncbi:methionyl-tRNA formyltransferase [Virgibacillus sp. 179-BFC.A HS]|uniref:Methionyl-tRNA formyltransferase n=1 Tax=Tigheibacillus jepli TaxID=3035914 RepID=A0ABU5CJE8_9BACI|nr:methionyl-tRNA formyltransferase [Virgibacillus sp. 179-BFC.A HS]MDY0405929.1 methionyl-tRNA formyltransferase [Virgibacillus sp. 179-BFC.A HS]
MKKIVFMGTPEFSVRVLQVLLASEYEVVLVVTQPDRPKGRKKILTPSPVKEEALKHGIPIFQPEKLRNDFQTIQDCNPDLIVTAAYGQILPREVLEAPKYGCVNVHASLLPKLRGGAPIHYAIMQGYEETGVTIMFMAEKLDAGDMLNQKSIPITEHDHVGSMHDKLSELGAELLMETLPDLFAGNITPQKQNEAEATFAPNIKREQEIINWEKSDRDIYNLIRGLHPWPVAYTRYEGKPMKIWWGEPDGRTHQGEPGEIVAVTTDAFTVVCGNKRGLRVVDIQPAGKNA